jgi:hypothetical protein
LGKYKNYHGCDVTAKFEANVWRARKDHESGRVKSPFTVIFEIIAQAGKFNPRYMIAHAFTRQTIDVVIEDCLQLTGSCGKILSSVLAFSDINILATVPAGELYNSYEKLYLPFDEKTWICLFCTFITAFAIIFICNFMPMDFQNLVYGVGVKMPAFNVVETFFGISQKKLPKTTFARIILLLFIMFSRAAHRDYGCRSNSLSSSQTK